MIVLETNNLGKKFKGSTDWALRDVSLKVNKGEIFGVIGESGCGKTTLLRMIAGFDKASEGNIKLNDLPVLGDGIFVKPQNRNVGIVFQDYALFPHKTVRENIIFGLFRLSSAGANRKANKIMEICELEGLDNRYPHQLSGGQMQRVALARALAPEPELILFDEPFSNIDTLRKYQIRENIRNIILLTNTTAVFVTHDTKDVLAIANSVAVLKKGRVEQIGTPKQVYSEPVNAYVANFFGKTNILKATVSANGFDTPIGFIESANNLQSTTKEVTLSIRPEDFEFSEDRKNCFCGVIKNERFFGEFKELTCEITGRYGHKTELILHTSPKTTGNENLCHFAVRPDKITILKESIL